MAQTLTRDVKWAPLETVQLADEVKLTRFSCEHADYEDNQVMPLYMEVIEGDNRSNWLTESWSPTYIPMGPEESKLAAANFTPEATNALPELKTAISRKQDYIILKINPFRKNPATGGWEKLAHFSLEYRKVPKPVSKVQARTYAPHSVLASGDWYKLAVNRNGIVYLGYSDLVSLGIDPKTIDPRNIKIYGKEGGMLPQANADSRYDDLPEKAIFVSGESDGKFDAGDYILFYGENPNQWYYDSTKQRYLHQVHLYDDYTYYFITASGGVGKRMINRISSSLSPTKTVSSFDDFGYHESDQVNLLKSGRMWFGEVFDILTNYDFDFSFPNLVPGANMTITTNVAARSIVNPSSFTVSVPSVGLSFPMAVSAVSGIYYNDYASVSETVKTFVPSSSDFQVNVSFNKYNASSIGWLNYIAVNARRQLSMYGDQMLFQDAQSIGTGEVAEYHLGNVSSNIQVWDVTNPVEPVNLQGTIMSGEWVYRQAANSLCKFVAFNGSSFTTPVLLGAVANQDLHGLASTGTYDMLIVAAPDFMNQAQQLADFHLQDDGVTSVIVTPAQIFNEFSSGSQDVSAIRDFVKMFYDQASTPDQAPRYLMLFGDGSYDPKSRLPVNTNFITAYQSPNSVSPTQSYVSDDYFGLLDDNEGRWLEKDPDLVDIGVGRLPVQNVTEAQAVVNKIIHYHDPASLGDWRNVLCFVADDEDGNLHMSQSDQLATMIDTTYDDYDIDKIFFDSYQQLSTSAGDRYPDVTDAINRRIESGALLVNYTGHGGELGWAHERVLNVSDIKSYQNLSRLPVFMTATCEFSRFDDPERTSAGEYMLLNPNGGGVALFTTVRLVNAGPNFALNKNFLSNLFEEVNGEMPRMGDLYRITKVLSGSLVNNRNFTLLGDPALRMSYPENRVVTTSLNGHPWVSYTDTLRALEKVTITGYVADPLGNKMSKFNGIIYPTLYDKSENVKTLANDGGSPFKFNVQKRIIYKGKASVNNGEFTFSFIVPKDIAYQYGLGRLSYYSENTKVDAHGSNQDFWIGGSLDSSAVDTIGPEIKLYMNNEQFVFGGITDENPVLLATVFDSSGVNTVGNGVGHDITAVLDGQTDKTLVLNDYYEADLDQYQSGRIQYPFKNLETGAHSVKLKVWDVYNRSSEVYTEFVVSESAELALDHVLNYPNPFTTHTDFYFEHNQPGTDMDVEIRIYTVGGRLIKTIHQQMNTDGFRSEPIAWNGLDDFGDRIGKGVYLYRLRVASPDGNNVEKLEKLVILK
ncbi:MAG: type IX secretion system sortase PorU [Flavobacteriales bacterium]|nr:type IX secretion system sortase PorU [Flavobacteriales bacterium]MCB9446878.1 type IX secretion system sortase PorU [Flavobacteriales bacterium]